MIHMFNQHIICNNIIYCHHFQKSIYIKIPQKHEASELSIFAITTLQLLFNMHILLPSEKATTKKGICDITGPLFTL